MPGCPEDTRMVRQVRRDSGLDSFFEYIVMWRRQPRLTFECPTRNGD